MIKQVIIIRKDLNMRKGKMCAQAAHASMKIFFDRMQRNRKIKPPGINYQLNVTREMQMWIGGKFTKIVVGCDSEKELLEIYQKAKDAKLPCVIIKDCGATEFKEPTLTVVAIGAAEAEEIDKITGGLKLL